MLARAVSQVEGRQFGAVVTQSIRWTLDTKAVTAEMGEGWYDAHCRQTAGGDEGARLVCSACGSREVDFVVSGERR